MNFRIGISLFGNLAVKPKQVHDSYVKGVLVCASGRGIVTPAFAEAATRRQGKPEERLDVGGRTCLPDAYRTGRLGEKSPVAFLPAGGWPRPINCKTVVHSPKQPLSGNENL